MAVGKKKQLTQEEELLLQDFSRNVSAKSSALFYGNALIVSVLPVFLYWRIHQMDIFSIESIVLLLAVTAFATYMIAFAYRNVKFVLKHKVAQKREEAITQEVLKDVGDNKRMDKKEKDDRILWKKNEVADYEATTYSIFYNNAIFLGLVIILSTYILRSFNPSFNYTITVAGSGALIALFSTGSQ